MKKLIQKFKTKLNAYVWSDELSEKENHLKRTLFNWSHFTFIGTTLLTLLAFFIGALSIFYYGIALLILFVISYIIFGFNVDLKLSQGIQMYTYITVTALFAIYMGGILHSGGIMLVGMYCMFMTTAFRDLRMTRNVVIYYVALMCILALINPYLTVQPDMTERNNSIFFTINMIWMSSAQVMFIISFIKQQVEIEQKENKYLKELDETKTRLYTNITHEFRTPITLILGMLDQIKVLDEKSRNAIRTISNNGKRLLRLVNQMLSLSKLESGKFHLQLIQADIIQYIQFFCKNMLASAQTKGISLHFTSSIDELFMDFDPHKMEEVLSNLLSNAIRYTEEGGKVEVKVKTQKSDNSLTALTIEVKDNGCGIPDKYMVHIFDRFYQIEESHQHHQEGSGIGLALVKENIKIMGGEVEVNSREGIGSIFKVILPIIQKAEINNIFPTQKDDAPITPIHELVDKNKYIFNGDLPILLIIEDHPEMIAYISSILESDYKIITAEDGKIGWQKALKYIPDIIVSDVMMPHMDGFEFLKNIKSNIRTNHIPVIMLTARADLASKLEGLELGAEAYLTKPFSKEELRIRLKKILELRKNLQHRYLSQNLLERPSDNRFRNEDQFMEKVHTILNQYLDDPTFGVRELAHAAGMSRSQLYRKFKALTNTSVDKYIRKYRLHQAMHLIKTTELNTSQVALEVGIPNQAYFSRVFKEEFDCPPSKVYV